VSKAPYFRIFIKEDDRTYLLCRIWQQKSDVSLLLKVNQRKNGTGGTLGEIAINSNHFDIHYNQVSRPVDIEHTSIHATGQSHTKMKEGGLYLVHDKYAITIPLTDLKTSKHLSTLLCRELEDEDIEDITRQNDVLIERDKSQRFTALDLLAIPKSANVRFSANWEIENDKMVNLSMGISRLEFNGYDVLVFARHSDQFEKGPPITIQLPDMNDKVPFITKIDDEKLTVNISSLTFSDAIQSQEKGNDPYDGFTVITATSRFL